MKGSCVAEGRNQEDMQKASSWLAGKFEELLGATVPWAAKRHWGQAVGRIALLLM